MEYRTIKRNGKNRVIPVSGYRRKGIYKNIGSKEKRDMARVGIKHPGSLTDIGYHIIQPAAQQHAALNKAVSIYGKKKVLEKLADLYRLDHNRPELKAGVVNSIKYVSGGKRND